MVDSTRDNGVQGPGASAAALSSDVLVVGGGMAGLAAALGLQNNGAAVRLVEQASEFGEVGAGLQMAPNATRILERWGLLEELLDVGVRPRNLVFRDALSGEELARQDLQGDFVQRYGAPYIVVHRSDLHRILLEACRRAGVELLNDVRIDSVETHDAGARAHARDGRVFEAGVVIGADGLKSALRPSVVADEPVPSGYVAYRGTVQLDDGHAGGDREDVVVYFGPHCHLVQYPLRRGELLNTVAVFKSPSFEQGNEQYGGVDELEAAYKDCVPQVRRALENVGTGMRWPMYDREPVENWISGRLVLMGDAAHPMLQYLAQGACQALEDAEALQDLSAGTVFGASVPDAAAWDGVLREFNDVRAPRTARVQRTARLWGESWHVTGIARLLRNMLFQDPRPSHYMYTDWLYGGTPDNLS